ncbi:MAG: hypothetical protein K9M13_01785 [Simkaniaceae bacterium]|nr:hypothetical protein [Simkaniaceae bacterium]
MNPLLLLLCFILHCGLHALTQHGYDPQLSHYALKNRQKEGVAIVAFNRPHYFKQLLASIEETSESQELPFFFFLDGGPGAKQQENIDLISQANIATKHIIIRPVNYGIPKNHIDAKRFMFDWCHFESAYIFEEDVKISSSYFKTLKHLREWANKKYDNIGTIQLWNEQIIKYRQKTKNRALIQETTPFYSLVAYCLDRSVWERISPLLYEYERRFIDPLVGVDKFRIDRSKPGIGIFGDQVRSWLIEKFNDYRKRPPLFSPHRTLPSKLNFEDYAIYCTNQDTVTCLSLWLTGHIRLQSVATRVIHIGQVGFMNPSWPSHKKLFLHQFRNDSQLTEFIFR